MDLPPVILLMVGFPIFAFTMLKTAHHFRVLVDIEFAEFKDKWKADGRPVGGKASRKEASFLFSGISSSFCMMQWLVATPTWISSHPVAPQHLHRMRHWFLWSLPAWLLCFLAFTLPWIFM
jgi:hypothetical protein